MIEATTEQDKKDQRAKSAIIEVEVVVDITKKILMVHMSRDRTTKEKMVHPTFPEANEVHSVEEAEVVAHGRKRVL